MDGVLKGSNTLVTSFTQSNLSIFSRSNLSTPFKGYVNDFRLTTNVARYTADFSVPTGLFPDPDPFVGRIMPFPLRRDFEDGGPLSIIEPVTRLNSPTNRRVRLCDQRSGRIVREGWSDPTTGLITFTHLRQGPWVLYALDHTNEFEAVAIADRLATVDGLR